MTVRNGIELSEDGAVLTVAIDRSHSLNALNPEAHKAMHNAFDAFAARDDLHIAVIRGAGERAFCTGSDLKVRADMGGDDMPPSGFGGLAERFDLDKPVIAAVNGHAIGGGLELVLACDLAIAVRGAKFGLPEPRVGLAAAGGLHRLARCIPAKHAMEIALTGVLFDADRAKEYGLVNTVVEREDFEDALTALIGSLLKCAPLSLRATKQMMRGGEGRTLEQAFSDNYPAHEAMLVSADAAEGQRAFIEKRAPLWQGR